MGLWNRFFGTPTRDEFAQMMLRAMRKHKPTGAIDYRVDRFSLEYRPNFFLYLHNAYSEYIRAPRAVRKEIIQRFASIIIAPDSGDRNYESVKPDLLPKVRERFFHQSAMMLHPGKPAAPAKATPHRVISEDLTVELVCDYPEQVQTISQGALNKWQISFDDALAVARDNLWRKSNAKFNEISPGFFVSPWEDTHDASRLFLHDLIWQLPVKGNHVAMVPNRNVLLVTGSDDPDGLLKMAATAERVLRDPRPMSGIAVRLDGAHWKPFLPPPDRADYWPIMRLAIMSAGRDYVDQKKMLDEHFVKIGRDAYVATQTVMKSAEEKLWTWTSWAEGITDMLLPRADWVAFGRKGTDGKLDKLGFAPWHEVIAAANNLMDTTDYYPIRFQIRSFPIAEQLAKMNFSQTPTHYVTRETN